MNVSIAVLILLIICAVYWYAFRPLPQTSGEISAPVSGPATIRRDARGVPHIEAASWQDAIFLQGFVTAQDRLWQMDGLRRYGAGELSEVLGRGTLRLDERSRAMQMPAIANNDLKYLTPEDRAVMVEYARGVNFYIGTHRGDYPLEFQLPGHAYSPRPWTIVDTMLVGLDMYRDLTDVSDFEFDKGTLLNQTSDPAKVMTLFPAIDGGYVNPGSNAWAVSGARTADGKPMLANDPHLNYGIPSTWYLVHLKAPGLNVIGAALPGLPGVITGHNDQIAWGVTNLQADVMDLYIEQMDESRGTYVYQGALQQATLDREFIGVRGGAPVQLNTWVTRHGPVLQHANGRTFAMRWSATDGFGFPFFDIDRASNWNEFRAAIRRFWGPGQNFVYADRAGNIGYQASGSVPIRKDFYGDVPLDGASGKYEWSGYIPFDELPSIYNPGTGIVATANQDPFPPLFPYGVDGNFADVYRVNQIRDRLNAKRGLSVSDMLAIQRDVYAAFNKFLAHEIVAADARHRTDGDFARQAIEILRRWNGQMDKSEAAPAITELVRDEISTALVLILTNPSKAKAAKSTQVPKIFPRPQIIQTLLTTRPPGWVSNNDWDSWLMQQFSAALQLGRNRLGSPVSKWEWGRVLQWNLEHPVGKQLPFVNRFFDIDNVPMSGCGTCVKQTTPTHGPSERMVVDLGDLDKSVQNITLGESGNVASRHYRDQWPDYYNGTSFPMQFYHLEGKDVLTVKPQ